MTTLLTQVSLLELAMLKTEQKALAIKVSEAEARLIGSLRQDGQKTASVVIPSGDAIKCTLVEPQTTVIDEERLKKSVQGTTWKKITKTVLDKEKLEAAVAIGMIDLNVVAAVSTIKDIKASVRLSGTYTPGEIKSRLVAVSIKDASGRVKPAAKRLVQPKP